MTITNPGQVPDPTPLQLTNVAVDYDTIQNAYIADLQLQGSWSNLVVASAGRAIIRWIAAATAFMSGGVARALQENYPDTARTPGGVYRAQRLFAGSSIIRARAGQVSCTLTRTDQLSTNMVIPAYQQFRVGGVLAFNRTSIVVPASGQVSCVLYIGQVVRQVVQTDGTAFQRFVVGTPNLWDASNDDLIGTDANGAQWTSTTSGLWQQTSTSQVFRGSTLTDGTIECRMGDGNYALAPPPGPFTFTYVSLGTAAATQNGPLLGSTVTPVVGAYTVTGASTSGSTSSQDAPGPEFYKAIGTGQASNNGRAVARPDYRAIALQYDGVVDAVFRAQAELNPADIRWMNIVAVSLITTNFPQTKWTDADWIRFKNYFENEIGISNVYLTRVDPEPVPLNVELNVGAEIIADENALTTLVQGVIQQQLTPRAGIMGSTVYPSDFVLAIAEQATYQQAPNEAGSLIDYIDPVHPRQPVVLGPIQYPTMGNLVVNTVRTTRGVNAASTGQNLGL